MQLNMNRGLLKTIITLPGTVLVFVPAIILAVADNTNFSHHFATPDRFLFWLALLPAGVGLGLAVWTVKLFMTFGDGTPAPWDPPQKLVIRGPYRHVRNPMISGVLLLLLAEAMLSQSWPLALWMGVFFIGNAIYFPLVEEKGLEKRFGDTYRVYKAHVPRWIPRRRPWQPENGKI
jgi:protein-S-isoprenylcysteine O-methyltransferase Ste14